jgi:hypothetical protein
MSKKDQTRTEAAVQALPLTTLPFVTRGELCRPHYWTVASVGEGFQAQIDAQSVGYQYANQYARWLHAHPDLVGMGTLGWIAADIDFEDSQRTGYWIGFFSRIEHFIFDAGMST